MASSSRPSWRFRFARLLALGAVAFVAFCAWLYARRMAASHHACFGTLKTVPYAQAPDRVAALPEIVGLDLPATVFEQQRLGWRDDDREIPAGPLVLRVRGYKRRGQTVSWTSIDARDPTFCFDGTVYTGPREIDGLDPRPLSLRHDEAAGVYVLAGADGKVYLSFRRSLEEVRSFRPAPRREVERLALQLAAIALALGAWPLLRAWRYFGTRGLARWREGRVNEGVIELEDGSSFPCEHARLLRAGEVLVSAPEDASLLRNRLFPRISGPPPSAAVGYRTGGPPAAIAPERRPGAALVCVTPGSHEKHHAEANRRARSSVILFVVAIALAAVVPPGRDPDPPSAPLPPRPPPPPPPPSRVVEIAAGWSHACARSDDGRVQCWGYNDKGKLGFSGVEIVGLDRSPAEAGDVDIGARTMQIAPGSNDTCAVIEEGYLRCWGPHYTTWDVRTKAQRPIGAELPPSAEGEIEIGGKAIAVALGSVHGCALIEGGRVRCWGWGGLGVLGYTAEQGDDVFVHPRDTRDVELGSKAIQIAARTNHTCAVIEGGRLRCWGHGAAGELGHGDGANVGSKERPLASAGDVNVGGPVTQVATGRGHTCALLEGGRVRCWGSGDHGQLGRGDARSIGAEKPPAAYGDVDVGGKAIQIAAGGDHTCAVLEGGRLRCWGRGSQGQLGHEGLENIGDRRPPAAYGDVDVGAPVVSVALGDDFTCALLEGARVRCWGRGAHGQLGRRVEGDHTTGTPSRMPDVKLFD